jgi:hypothetical protein
VIAYIEDYAARFNPPLRFGVTVDAVEQSGNGNGYLVRTTDGVYEADNVVVAAGTFQYPNIPSFSQNIPEKIRQLHSSEYRNPETLPEGNVLVVGSGQSGCQIAQELHEHGRQVFLCVGSAGRLPRRYREAPEETVDEPQDGYEQDMITELDLKAAGISTIIWATGYRWDYSWVQLPGFDEYGYPIQQRGVTDYPGLYFLGLHWLHTLKSGLFLGVGEDAEHIAAHIDGRTTSQADKSRERGQG